MADPFKEFYAQEKDLRMAERSEANQRLLKWKIAAAALSAGLALTVTALVVQRRPKQAEIAG